MSSFLDKSGLERYHNGIKAKLATKSDNTHTHDDRYYTESEINTKLAGKVSKRENGNYYNSVGSYYTGGTNPTYYRITLSDNALSIWNMQFIEISMRQNYNTGKSGKILINGYNDGSNKWLQLNASVLGNLTNDIKVYGYGGQYIYIGGGLSWGGISIDTVLVGDGATSKDITYSIDVVTSLPSGYVSATMLYYNVLSSHTHDDRYYTESEIDTKLSGKSDTSHNHSGVYSPVGHTHSDYITSQYLGENYYSKTEINDGFATASHNHDSKYAAISHNHDDRYYTESEINNKLSGKSDTSHNHSGVYAPASHSHSPSEISGYVGSSAEGTPFVLGCEGAGANGEWIDLNAYYSLKDHTHTSAPALDIRTTAPTSNNTSGKLKVAVLSSEPSRKYSGWLYIITG